MRIGENSENGWFNKSKKKVRENHLKKLQKKSMENLRGMIISIKKIMKFGMLPLYLKLKNHIGYKREKK